MYNHKNSNYLIVFEYFCRCYLRIEENEGYEKEIIKKEYSFDYIYGNVYFIRDLERIIFEQLCIYLLLILKRIVINWFSIYVVYGCLLTEFLGNIF